MASVTSLGLHEPAGLPYAIAESILPPDPSPDLYTWELFADENGDDELLSTQTCVIWSRGATVGRCFRFDAEGEPVRKALLAYFPSSEESESQKRQSSSSTASPAGPAPTPPTNSHSTLTKTLIVFLKTQARVYTFAADEHVVHMPFEVETAVAAPVGVLLQRKSKVDTTVPVTLRFPRAPPNSFVASQILPLPSSTFDFAFDAALGKPKPLPLRLSSTLETMWDTPLETAAAAAAAAAADASGWPRLVCLTDPMLEIGLVVAQSERTSGANKDRTPTTTFLDPAEEILHIESIALDGVNLHDDNNNNDNNSLTLAVTVNRETSMYTIWRMTYAHGGDRLLHATSKAKQQQQKQQKQQQQQRRRSSVQPGLAASGTTTPLRHASFRDSIGGAGGNAAAAAAAAATAATLPVKKTRRSERLDSKGKGKDRDRESSGPLEKVLSLEPDRVEVSRRQSRRASSLLARADLSASHDRQPPVPTTATGGRRSDSYGSQSQRGAAARVSSSGMGMGTGAGAGAGAGNAFFSQTLNSLLEAPVDGLLEELRAGGDFEGFHNMGLDDDRPEFDALSTEVVLTKIHNLSMDTANLRYSLSRTTPAAQLCKVFVLVGTPYSVDEPDRNYLLVCIQDTVDKRLQLLTLHVQGGDRDRDRGPTITWGQHRKAQNVADSCRVQDGGQAMILILSEGDGGQRQLSIQAPWSELTTVGLPPLSLHNRDRYAWDWTTDAFQSTTTTALSDVPITRFRFPRGRGVVDVVDSKGVAHQIQIQLEPSAARVRRVLDVLRSILPSAYAEKMVMGWWRIMHWLAQQPEHAAPNAEWTALATELCVLFLALLPGGATTESSGGGDSSGLAASDTTLTELDIVGNQNRNRNRNRNDTAAAPGPWALSKAWSWVTEGGAGQTPPLRSDMLATAVRLARRFMASPAGAQAVGVAGYLPTALGLPESTRRGAAWGVVMALHLYLEEEKLDILSSASSGGTMTTDLKMLVWRMARWLQWPSFAERYALELDSVVLPEEEEEEEKGVVLPLAEPAVVPSIFEWIGLRLAGATSEPFPSLGDVYAVVAQRNRSGSAGEGALNETTRWQHITPRTHLFGRFFASTVPTASSVVVVEAMHRCGFTTGLLDSLPEGVSAPFRDAISRCQQHPPAHWDHALYELVGRGDINTVLKATTSTLALTATAATTTTMTTTTTATGAATTAAAGTTTQPEEPESEERQVVIQALFRDDKRLVEAQNLLSSTTPRVVQLRDPVASWTESEYLEHQKELVTTVAWATLATAAGRGMLNYGFRFPLLTQTFSIQGFNLTCIVKPSNVAVGVDKAQFTEDKVNWAFFHQGVAYGLAISPRAKGIDTSWIVFNKPGGPAGGGATDLSHRHAGFLFALGLNGHLRSVAKWVAFKYLTPKHMMTSIGLLLGLAVSHLGTMDSLIVRLLSVHVTRMLPRGAAELNLSHQIQTTGIMGIGLLYYNSQHRRMSETMLSEIAYTGDEDEEKPLRNEGYRLAAAYALGFINLGKGGDRKGLSDMQITEQLVQLASATKKVELVNVLDRSAAAATMALALIYLQTEDAIVARKVDIPDSVLQFDYVRPDVLLLRTVAKNLILWSQIDATMDWVRASLPADYRDRARLDGVDALRSADLPFFAIVAGLCWASALRFAGTANRRVRDVLVHYLDRFRAIVQDLAATTFDAQMARAGARMCLDVLALAAATVMAGTGDLVVLRRLRALHGRDDTHTPYGSHLAAHLALGTLFLGSGTTTLGNSPLAVAALLVAFYPVFPDKVQDNGSHLQAFRHFWVLATEPRCLVTKDVATGQVLSVPVRIELKPGSLTLAGESTTEDTVLRKETPCLLPPLDDIVAVRTDAAAHGFWDLEIPFARDPGLRAAFRQNQTLYLRRRPAQASAFATTLQALGTAGTGMGTGAGAQHQQQHRDPLAWLFGLRSFAGLSRTEKAQVLDSSSSEGGGGGGSSALSTALDARLQLESSLGDEDGSGVVDGRVNRLRDLKLLFGWAEQRAQQRAEDGDGETTEGGDNWWMDDGAVDLLEGRAWGGGKGEQEVLF